MSLLRNNFPCPGGVSLLFDQPVGQMAEMREAIAMLTAIVAERLRRDRLVARTITVWLETRYQAGIVAELSSRTLELPIPMNDSGMLSVFTVGVVKALYRPHMFYRAAGVSCEDFLCDDTACDSKPVATKGHGRIASLLSGSSIQRRLGVPGQVVRGYGRERVTS